MADSASDQQIRQSCSNCGTELRGKFCHACGQKHINTRLTVPLFVGDTLVAITEIDSRLWRTILGLIKNPGRVALDYINGARASFISPTKYFLIIFAIYLATAVVSGAQDTFIDAQTRIDGDIQDENVEEFVTSFSEALGTVLREYINIIVFLAMPIIAFLFRWQYFRAKKNYPENLVFVAFTFGQGYLYLTFLILLQWAIGDFTAWPRYILLILTFTYSAHVFYGMRWFVTPFAILVSLGIYLTVQGSLGAAFAAAKLKGLL